MKFLEEVKDQHTLDILDLVKKAGKRLLFLCNL